MRFAAAALTRRAFCTVRIITIPRSIAIIVDGVRALARRVEFGPGLRGNIRKVVSAILTTTAGGIRKNTVVVLIALLLAIASKIGPTKRVGTIWLVIAILILILRIETVFLQARISARVRIVAIERARTTWRFFLIIIAIGINAIGTRNYRDLQTS